MQKIPLAMSLLVILGMFHSEANADMSLCYRGWNETEAGRNEEALKLFNHCLDRATFDQETLAQTYRNRGIVYRRLSRFYEAIDDFSRALEVRPDPLDYINRANSYSDIGRYEEALRDYDAAVELSPNLKNIYLERALVHERMGNRVYAEQDYRRAFELGARGYRIEHKFVEFGVTTLRDFGTPMMNMPVPQGFELVDAEFGTGSNTFVQRLIREGETLEDWSDMISYEQFDLDVPHNVALEQLMDAPVEAFVDVCALSRIKDIGVLDPNIGTRPLGIDPEGLSPLSYIEKSVFAFCDNRLLDMVEVTKNFENNGFLFRKVVLTNDRAFVFQYEWRGSLISTRVLTDTRYKTLLVTMLTKSWIQEAN